MFSKIFSYILGSPKPHSYEAIKLNGSLFKKDLMKSHLMIFETAVLGLKINKETLFEYFLTINDHEMLFPIKNDLHLKTFVNSNDESCLMWENGRSFFIFFIDDNQTSENEVLESFLTSICTLITSTELNIAISIAADDPSKYDFISNYDLIEDIDTFIETNYAHLTKNVEDLTEKLESLGFDNKEEVTDFNEDFPKACEVFKTKGDFYRFDSSKNKYTVSEENVTFALYQTAPLTYYIVVNKSSYDKITKETNIWYETEDKVIMWVKKTKNEFGALCFIFYDQSDYEELKEILVKCQYEASSNKIFNDLNEEQRQWLIKEQNSNEGFNDSQISNDNDIDFDADFDQSQDTKNTNRTSTQAYLHDRTLVIKGDNSLSVYKTNQKNNLVHLMNLPLVESLDIAEAKMFQSDTNLLLRENDTRSNKIYQYDIVSGEIVSKWSGGSSINSINAICLENKNDQITDNQIVLGINNSSLFVLDGRLNKKDKTVNVKTYKSKVNFNCIATSESGSIAVGSSTGEVRLYKNPYHNAKTLFPCFGDAVKGIDITRDGRYILATCDKYLLVIFIAEVKNRMSCYNIGEGDKKEHHYKTLLLNPIDVLKLELNEYSFTIAKFDNNTHEKESQIISSIGEYLIIWNFGLVKKGILNQYRIKKISQNVIENQFKYNKNHIVVTTPNSLCIQTHK